MRYGLGFEVFFVLSASRAGAGALAEMWRPYTLEEEIRELDNW